MQVVIIGGAAGSKIAQDIFLLENIHIRGFMNNYVPKELQNHLFAPVLGDYRTDQNMKILQEEDVEYFIGTGNNKMRHEHVEALRIITEKLPINAIHPSAVISLSSKMGKGNLVMPLAVINPYSKIGNGTIINTSAIIEHDNKIGDYTQIAPGARLGGYVTVEKYATIGIGAVVIDRITIGEGSLVAGGASVVEDVKPYTMVAGVPAVKKKDL